MIKYTALMWGGASTFGTLGNLKNPTGPHYVRENMKYILDTAVSPMENVKINNRKRQRIFMRL